MTVKWFTPHGERSAMIEVGLVRYIFLNNELQ